MFTIDTVKRVVFLYVLTTMILQKPWNAISRQN